MTVRYNLVLGSFGARWRLLFPVLPLTVVIWLLNLGRPMKTVQMQGKLREDKITED